MSELTIHRADALAAEIRTIDSQTREIAARGAIEIGTRLIEAKELVDHGEWEKWLKENVNYSQSTANNFMRVAKEYGSNPQSFGNLTYTQAVALLAVPSEEREQFAEDVGASELSTRELKEAVKARDEAQKQAKKLEADLKKALEQAEQERKQREELAADIARLQIDLAEAKIAGDAEAADKLKAELLDAQDKVKQLEAELRTKPIDVPGVVEKIPAEVEAELEELRKKVAQPNTSAAAVKFRIQFETLTGGFTNLLATLAEVEPEQREKFTGALRLLIGKMSEKL